jgi:hypothetical protein
MKTSPWVDVLKVLFLLTTLWITCDSSLTPSSNLVTRSASPLTPRQEPCCDTPTGICCNDAFGGCCSPEFPFCCPIADRCCAAGFPICCKRASDGPTHCCPEGTYCCPPEEGARNCCSVVLQIVDIPSPLVHLSTVNITINASSNFQSMNISLYSVPNSNSSLASPPIFLSYIFVGYFLNGPAIFPWTILAITEQGQVPQNLLGGSFLIEVSATENREVNGPGPVTVARSNPFQIVPCNDCQTLYNVSYTTCYVASSCSDFGCEENDHCSGYIDSIGNLVPGAAEFVQFLNLVPEGELLFLFTQLERNVSVILHNEEGVVVVRPLSQTEPLKLFPRRVGGCKYGTNTLCAAYHVTVESSGASASFITTSIVIISPKPQGVIPP